MKDRIINVATAATILCIVAVMAVCTWIVCRALWTLVP